MYRQKTIYSFIEAWNVDGSSSDEPLNGYSWISFWEEQTGQQRGLCSYSGCHNYAKDGGHIWLKGNGLYIAPICPSCNSSSNPKRMQGGYSSLKTGTTVVKITTTEDMELSERRYSSDYSKDRESYGYHTNKDEYYDSQNSYHSYDSYSSDRSGRSSRSSNQSRSSRSYKNYGSNQYGSKSSSKPRRSCVECGTNISYKPDFHSYCSVCYSDSY